MEINQKALRFLVRVFIQRTDYILTACVMKSVNRLERNTYHKHEPFKC